MQELFEFAALGLRDRHLWHGLEVIEGVLEFGRHDRQSFSISQIIEAILGIHTHMVLVGLQPSSRPSFATPPPLRGPDLRARPLGPF